ncbi:MAG: hypothetical protein JOS17DRAFT_97944 [Linnemannia elongata]|nr:MAG: hypothetical protein JOS17DRAFT_97944 [Linnemannia elongata]
MTTKPDPERAASPPHTSSYPHSHPRASLDHYAAPRSSTSRAQPRQSEDRSLPPLHHADISSTSTTTTARILQNPSSSDLPVNDNNAYTGRPVLDTSRRYSTSSGYAPAPPSSSSVRSSSSLGSIYSPTSVNPNLSNKRRSGQTPTLSVTPESPSLTRSSTGGFHTFNPDYRSSHDADSINAFPLTATPQSPSFSISSLSNIIPISNSISSIASTAASKPPVLEHRHPISVKDFESIHLLGPNQKAAIKTLCSSRVLSRIDTIGWFSILGAQKYPTISTRQARHRDETSLVPFLLLAMAWTFTPPYLFYLFIVS